jgi:hypothetical protein
VAIRTGIDGDVGLTVHLEEIETCDQDGTSRSMPSPTKIEFRLQSQKQFYFRRTRTELKTDPRSS